MRFPLPLPIAMAACAVASSRSAYGSVYEKDVLPILEKHCIKCHNNDKMKAGVSVEVNDMRTDIGRIVIPGDPRDSMLYEVLASPNVENPMPPKGGPLSDKEIATVREWIQGGALFKGDPAAEGDADKAGPVIPRRKPMSGSWTNKEGKTIEADLLRVLDDRAILRLPNGRIYKYPLADLSPESQAKVKAFEERGGGP